MESMDVAVIGGGIVGLMTARLLAQAGRGVALIEAGDFGAAASGANAGSIHLQLQYPEFEKYGEGWAHAYVPCLRFLKQSLALWQALPGELGTDLGVTLAGGLVVATDDAQMARIAAKARIEAEAGVETAILSRDEILAEAPYLSPATVGGGLCAMEGKANPLQVTPALVAAAEAAGAEMRPRTAVTGLNRDGAGWRVDTTAGPLRAGRIVNAAGAQAGRIGAMVGTPLEIHGFPLQVTVTEAVGKLIPHLIYSAAGKLSLKQVANGGCVIGGGWSAAQRADGTLVTDPRSLAGNMGMAAGVVPAVGAARAIRSWTAWVNGTPDWRPILGEAPGASGVIHALFPWVGFSAAPMTAAVAADLVLGRDPAMPLAGVSVLCD